MTPEALAAALRLRLPNTEIVLGDRPGRVVVKMAPSPYALIVFIALSKSGFCADVLAKDPDQRPRDSRFQPPLTVDGIVDRIMEQVDAHTTPDPRKWHQDPAIEPRIRAWAGLPDMPPSLKDRARALLDSDRKALVIMRDELAQAELRASALERALAVTP